MISNIASPFVKMYGVSCWRSQAANPVETLALTESPPVVPEDPYHTISRSKAFIIIRQTRACKNNNSVTFERLLDMFRQLIQDDLPICGSTERFCIYRLEAHQVSDAAVFFFLFCI